jgi:uncharacterized protein YjbJ (UPF0337 family)
MMRICRYEAAGEIQPYAAQMQTVRVLILAYLTPDLPDRSAPYANFQRNCRSGARVLSWGTEMESDMNSDEIKGKWKQLTGDVKSRWGKLTDDDLTQIDSEKDKLVGKIQERYGKTREEAEKELENW